MASMMSVWEKNKEVMFNKEGVPAVKEGKEEEGWWEA